MLRLWRDAHPRRYLRICVHDWKPQDSICWRCFVLIRQLFKLDADYVEALWVLDQPASSLDMHAMLRDTLAALEQLPQACSRFRNHLPSRAHPTLGMLEATVRKRLNPAEAYNMVPGRNPQNG